MTREIASLSTHIPRDLKMSILGDRIEVYIYIGMLAEGSVSTFSDIDCSTTIQRADIAFVVCVQLIWSAAPDAASAASDVAAFAASDAGQLLPLMLHTTRHLLLRCFAADLVRFASCCCCCCYCCCCPCHCCCCCCLCCLCCPVSLVCCVLLLLLLLPL